MKKYWKTICLFLLAFIPRIYQLGFDVINIDAPFWKENTYNFIGLFFRRRFGDMAITHHPGVTLMWLGGWAMKIFRGIYYFTHGMTAPDTNTVYLWTHFAQKLPIALITSAFVVFVYWVVKRLFDERSAILAAILLALEPFFLAHSRVFHLDALLTVFMVSSILMLLLYLRERNRRWLLVSGVLGGLALLTKSTALFLPPFVLLVLVIDFLASERTGLSARPVLADVVLWGFVALAVFSVVWPSMWVQPLATLKLYFSGIFNEAYATDPTSFAASRHIIFGRETYDPAWYYYPLVLAFRLSPVVLVFGVIGVVWGFRGTPLFLILYSLFFLTALSIPAKKLDRYILPAIPFFCVLAAYGITRTFERLRIKRFLALCVTVFSVFTVFTLFNLHPDYGFHFSPLFGGARMGLKFDSDYWWGEGHKKAADYLNSKPNVKDLKVALYDFRSFEPFFEGQTLDAGGEAVDQADYFVYSIKDRPGLKLEHKVLVGSYPLWGIYRNETDR